MVLLLRLHAVTRLPFHPCSLSLIYLVPLAPYLPWFSCTLLNEALAFALYC
jgi:hypothetical protein